MASSASTQKHEVFISVQKDDTGKFIADLLERSLRLLTVPFFKDEKKLRQTQKGANLGRELKEAIRMSKISVVLFSKDYFGSSWCLEELYVIMESRKEWGLIVLPIFYELDPSDVRKHRGVAGKVVNIQRKEGVWYRRWKSAMKEAADLCGWPHRGNNRIDSLLIGKLAEDIVNKRIPTNLVICIYPLRYDTFDQYMNLFLQVGKGGVLIVGISGRSGMGKTATAKAVYDQISWRFEGSSYLANVDKNSRKPNGLAQLQEKLLSDILLRRNVKVTNPDRGRDTIKENLSFRRVLIVLDDVDELDQLYALVGNRSWFGLGSKIIITTARLHLLYRLDVDQVFSAQGLPLPLNIKVIWEQFQQSCRIRTGLKECVQALHRLTLERQVHLRTCLLKVRQRNAIQAKLIADLEQAQVNGSGLIEHIAETCMIASVAFHALQYQMKLSSW